MSSTDELYAERETERESRPEATDESTGRLAGVRERVRSPFSLRTFLLALVLTVVASVIAGFVPFLPASIATLAGVFGGAFTLGLLRSKRSYLEVALAGTATAVVAALSQFLLLSVVGNLGVPVAAAGAGAGFLVAVLGHYLGRDLRDGLTREL